MLTEYLRSVQAGIFYNHADFQYMNTHWKEICVVYSISLCIARAITEHKKSTYGDFKFDWDFCKYFPFVAILKGEKTLFSLSRMNVLDQVSCWNVGFTRKRRKEGKDRYFCHPTTRLHRNVSITIWFNEFSSPILILACTNRLSQPPFNLVAFWIHPRCCSHSFGIISECYKSRWMSRNVLL